MLAAWVPRTEDKDGKPNPEGIPTDWPYIRKEAARFFNYNWGEFQRAPADEQAEVIAHYNEHNMREAYLRELYEFRDVLKKPKAPDYGLYRQGAPGGLFVTAD